MKSDQLCKSHPVEGSATNKPPVDSLATLQVTPWRDHLHNKLPSREIRLFLYKSPCRELCTELSYITTQRVENSTAN